MAEEEKVNVEEEAGEEQVSTPAQEEAPPSAPAEVLEPDLGLVKELISLGGDSLKKCYQCATCSVVCPLSPEDNPFPRKEMIWSQWGLKDKLVSNVDIWLCHQCADCSDYCPRGAKPGEVLAALRQYAFNFYAFPPFMGKLVSKLKYLPILLAVPVALLLIVMSIGGGVGFPEAEKIVFAKWIDPTKGVDVIFVPFFILAIISLLFGLSQFMSNIHERAMKDGWAENKSFTAGECISNIIGVLGDILAHKRFKECEANKGRYSAHLLVFYGFIALFIVTGLVATFYYANKFGVTGTNLMGNPMPFSNPVKWLANIGGIAILIGVILMTMNRLNQAEKMGKGGYPDWALIGIIILVVVTGFLAQFMRLANVAALAYSMYFVHLVFVFWLIAYLPYSKLAHLAYRTVAMAYARHQGREMMTKFTPGAAIAAAPPAEPAEEEAEAEAEEAPAEEAAEAEAPAEEAAEEAPAEEEKKEEE